MAANKPQLQSHTPTLRRYARALTGSVEQGDALTLKTIDCAQSLSSFLPKDMSLKVWLYSVMHNLTLDFLSEIYGEVNQQSLLPYVNPDELNDSDLTGLDIKGALAHLNLEQREAFLLTSLEQLDYEDTCTILGFKRAKLIDCLDQSRESMCQYLFAEQFDDLQRAQ